MRQILQALVYLASKRIIHRDMKPDNILCDDAGNFYLADFGLSKIQDMGLTGCGSPLYMAPEIFSRVDQTPKLDLWSLGVLVLEVCGIKPKFPFKDIPGLVQNHQKWHQMLIDCAEERLPDILPMFKLDPLERYSAKACLAKIFNGKRKIEVKPITPDSSSNLPTTQGNSSAATPSPGKAGVIVIKPPANLSAKKSSGLMFPIDASGDPKKNKIGIASKSRAEVSTHAASSSQASSSQASSSQASAVTGSGPTRKPTQGQKQGDQQARDASGSHVPLQVSRPSSDLQRGVTPPPSRPIAIPKAKHLQVGTSSNAQKPAYHEVSWDGAAWPYGSLDRS
jgi:serine/threonine protein kinase